VSHLLDQALLQAERHQDAASYYQARADYHRRQAERAERIRRALERLVD